MRLCGEAQKCPIREQHEYENLLALLATDVVRTEGLRYLRVSFDGVWWEFGDF